MKSLCETVMVLRIGGLEYLGWNALAYASHNLVLVYLFYGDEKRVVVEEESSCPALSRSMNRVYLQQQAYRVCLVQVSVKFDLTLGAKDHHLTCE